MKLLRTTEPLKNRSTGREQLKATKLYRAETATGMHRDRLASSWSRFVESNGVAICMFGKTAVHGMLDRDTREIRCKVVPNVKRETLQNEILNNIQYGSRIYTDEAPVYHDLEERARLSFMKLSEPRSAVR